MTELAIIKEAFRMPIKERMAELEAYERKGYSIKNCLLLINGHTFIRTRSYMHAYLWMCKPTRSARTFFFLSRNHAHIFANTFPDKHRPAYWDKLWRNMPIYHREYVIESLLLTLEL